MADFVEDMEAGRIPQVYTWRGKPISKIPREELERLFIEARKEIDDLHGLNLSGKIEHLRSLASVRRPYES